ncbi:HNH endonuclease signature motif containing protein [Serinicoccus marinus]|uniref:HNH endonuclease signature motif containing protein n=1 Tax=Serinicoccus marinus TaxID=247333 RepID=UPI00122E7959|nr:HNH endonuclease signature motif containing protein [Serinicoccus marinus]
MFEYAGGRHQILAPDLQGEAGHGDSGDGAAGDAGVRCAGRARHDRRGAGGPRQKGFTSVEELTQGQRAKWRTETKRAACAEVELKLGMGVTEARHLVALACAPAGVRSAVLGALDRGEVTWPMVRSFWRRCGSLPAERAGLVVEGLFGDDPETAVSERLDADGAVRERPWHAADYAAALEREARRADGEDVVAERERRRAAYRARRASVQVDDDGTATLSVTSSVVSIVAAHTRIERAARLLRKQGDPRTLDQLRADVAASLLVHGQVPEPDRRDDEDRLVTPDRASIARVVTGMPAVELQVVVPWDALAGQAACAGCMPRTRGRDASSRVSPSDSRGAAGRPGPSSHTPAGAVEDVTRRAPGGDRRGTGQVGGGEVGMLLGRQPAYLAPGHLRELALTPGTTLSRLLIDPADGRLVERSTASYRPDAAMRRQVLAADLHSRSPGSRQPGAVCELDHVQPWSEDSTGGATAEINLVALAKRPHELKTRGWALSEINDVRDLTWMSLLGQVETTRVHDYRQYAQQSRGARPADAAVGDGSGSESAQGGGFRSGQAQGIGAATGDGTACDPRAGADRSGRGGVGSPASRHEELLAAVDRRAPLDPALVGEPLGERADLEDRRDLLARAFYAALAHRGPGAFLEDRDDHPGSGEHGGPLAGWMWATRTTSSGQRRSGADPGTPTVDRVLGLDEDSDTDRDGSLRDEVDTPPEGDAPPF